VGDQFRPIRYRERLVEIRDVPSVRSVGDSYGNALAGTVKGYYKAERVGGPAHSGARKTIAQLELAVST